MLASSRFLWKPPSVRLVGGPVGPQRVNLAYTCVKPLVRLYVCQRVAFFMTHFGSILGPF